MTRVVVVAAVIWNPVKDSLLISLRGQHQHQGNRWEFPGGKVEPNENHFEALARELREEIGISIEDAHSWLQLDHDYEDKQVSLDFWQVLRFSGTPLSLEQQSLRWVKISDLRHLEFPAANQPVVDALISSAF